ncbi:ty3-gypsy retrotransposon protein [Tanacetum coccineum]
MDFITHLPLCSGKATVLVAVDRLSKHSHFCPLEKQFTAPQVAEIFVRDVIKLHGFPSLIVSDRNSVFMSSFWKEIFKLQGTTLSMSSAYHPQFDGQTEVLQYLPWAEWCYNTSWHSSIKMTPFEAVYGRPLPSLKDYVSGTSKLDAVDDLLHNKTNLISQLQANIQRAQLRMRHQAKAHRSDVHFQVDDWVFVKLQPYCQSSVALRQSHKLSKRFFGPFRIVERIEQVAYRQQLPAHSQIHNIFHVSVLKKCHGDPHAQQHQTLPLQSIGSQPIILPYEVLGFRKLLVHDQLVPQVLIRWQDQTPSEATWEHLDAFRKDFPTFHLEDKVLLGARGNDANPLHKETDPSKETERQSTRKTRTPTKLNEFV